MTIWDGLISELPGAHALQSSAWSEIKARYGWQPFYLVWDAQARLHVARSAAELPALLKSQGLLEKNRARAAALVLQRSVTLGGFAAPLRILYTPKGPLLDWHDQALRRAVLTGLHQFARRRSAIFIKMDPDVGLGTGIPGGDNAWDDPLGAQIVTELRDHGWRFSEEQIQFRNTVNIQLAPDEETLLAQMKQKTRYNIRLAQRKGVVVRSGGLADLDMMVRMYAETSVRDGFVIRDAAYYLAAWTAFLQAGMADPLIAEVEGEPVAAIFVVRFAARAWYIYGMSRDLHRDRMPNYLLQWEAMRRARQAGCSVYDLWGAPDEFVESDPLWGVYRFKEGLGGQVWRGLGAWDLPVQPWLYRLYTEILPRLLDRMRRRGKQRTRQTLGIS